jgi:hypothetical protein
LNIKFIIITHLLISKKKKTPAYGADGMPSFFNTAPAKTDPLAFSIDKLWAVLLAQSVSDLSDPKKDFYKDVTKTAGGGTAAAGIGGKGGGTSGKGGGKAGGAQQTGEDVESETSETSETDEIRKAGIHSGLSNGASAAAGVDSRGRKKVLFKLKTAAGIAKDGEQTENDEEDYDAENIEDEEKYVKKKSESFNKRNGSKLSLIIMFT